MYCFSLKNRVCHPRSAILICYSVAAQAVFLAFTLNILVPWKTLSVVGLELPFHEINRLKQELVMVRT